MKLSFILVLSLLLSHLVFSQTDFRPGFVIQQSGDTLRGEIDYRGDLMMGEICRFNQNGQIREFTPYDIRAYRFVGDKFYVSRLVGNRQVFLEYLVNGELDIYYLRDHDGDHYYAETAMEGLREIPYNEGVKSMDGKHYKFRSKGHIGVLQHFTNEAPELFSEIQRIQKPTHRNLSRLAENYHEQVCYSAEECVIYEKETPLLRSEIEFLGGGLILYNPAQDLSGSYSSVQTGFVLHINMPRVNEKIYFRTGVLLAPIRFDEGLVAVYKFPAQFEYVYPKGTIRPKLFYGINLYKPFFLSTAMGGGINVNMNKSISLSFTYDIDFVPNERMFFRPESLFSQALFAGVIIKL